MAKNPKVFPKNAVNIIKGNQRKLLLWECRRHKRDY